MKKALHAKPFRLQMPGHTPRHARPEPARSKLLRGVSLCLAAVCLAASVSFQPATAATSMASLQNKLNSLSKSIDQHKKELSDAKKKEAAAKALESELKERVGVIQSQISVLSTQIAAVQNNIGQTEQKITAKEGEITQKQAEIDSQWGDFKKHMAAMQELRDGGSVAMLSAVNDLYELLTFNEVMQDISIKDTEIMDNMKAAKSALEADKVEAVEVNKESGVITVQLKKEAAATPAPDSYVTFYGITQKATQSKTVYYTMLMEDLDTLTGRLQEHGVTGTRISSNTSSFLMEILVTVVLPVVLIWVVAGFLFRKMGGSGGPMGVGKSNAKVYVQKETGVTFKDVAGEDEAKESLVEVVDFLHNPQKYSKIGAKLPKGALLVGPPGTGKTLLAKAVAGEAGVPFFSISGSDFVEMFVGVGASRVRDLFEDAKKNAPCIVFIDEIDAVARRRGTGMGGGHDEREQTLNQLLVEMDGFGVNEGIIVMAATNRVDILDPAIMRPGRFDRKVHVGRPDIGGREEILKVHAKNKPLAEDVDLKQIAQTTAGFTGADLENLLNEAAIVAAKENRSYIIQKDIKESFLKVGVGPEKKSRIITEKEKKITAYHESGHAILFHVLPDVGPVYTVSIIPTGGGAAGYTMPLPERDEMFDTKGRMLQQIIVSLGGRVAEELIFDDITTGASQDIKQATELAKAMVTKYGFSENVGLINYNNDDDEVFIGRDLAHTRGYGEGVASKIDEEVKRIIDECYAKARAIIQENSDVLHKSADLLLEKEKIGRDEFEALFQSGAEVVTETTEE